jgi:predicted RNase H-related nuclease YkuK (DUF458 family)
MLHAIEKFKWHTGSDNSILFEDIVINIKESIDNGGKIFIGSDSFISKSKVNFATAICIHGDGKGGRYFFHKEFLPKKTFDVLVYRITEEVRRSIEIGIHLIDEHNVDPSDIELHIDVSPFHMKAATSSFSDMLSGYVNGAGFECRVKPNAWASQSVADRHSK